MSASRPIRVLVVDDHALFRKAIIQLLRGAPDFEPVGEAGTGLEAIQQATALHPDVILMDLKMPEMDGVEATRQIKALLPDVRVVILSMADPDDVLLTAIRSGATGHLLKEVDAESFFQALRAVARGETHLPGRLVAKVLAEFTHPTGRVPVDGAGPALHPREQEILALVAEGKSNKNIATALGIAENTVKNHVRNLLGKLHLENRVQAAAYALRAGVLNQPNKKSG